jgi:hypothetical protein
VPLIRVALWGLVIALTIVIHLVETGRQAAPTPNRGGTGVSLTVPAPTAAATVAPAEPYAGWTRGIATWYDAERKGRSTWYTRAGYDLYAAAGPALRELLGGYRHKQRFQIEIWSPKSGARFRIWVVDWCSCSKGKPRERLIDLAPIVFTKIGVPLSRGVQIVYVRVVP